MARLAGTGLPPGYTPGKRIPQLGQYMGGLPGQEIPGQPGVRRVQQAAQYPQYNPYAAGGTPPGGVGVAYGGVPAGGVGMEQILGAMTTTQQRAMEDRARAEAAIRMGGQQGISALQPWQQSISQLEAQPEAIGAAEEARIYEMGRTPIEAGAQAQMRGIQEGFFPGGFAAGAARGVRASATGQLGELARRTAMERTLRKRQDLLSLMGQQAQYGQTAAGIYGQQGQSLADLYGQTIAAVPQYQPPAQAPGVGGTMYQFSTDPEGFRSGRRSIYSPGALETRGGRRRLSTAGRLPAQL